MYTQTFLTRQREIAYQSQRKLFNASQKNGNAYDIIRFNPHANILWDGSCSLATDFIKKLTKKEKRQLKSSQVAKIENWVCLEGKDIKAVSYIADTKSPVRLEIIPNYHY